MMKSLRHRILLVLLGLCCVTGHAASSIVVVVPAHSEVEKLSREDVTNIFLGRLRQYPNGVAAYPIDQPAAVPEKAAFYRLLVNKEIAEINAYWARLIFSGRTSPPQQARSSDDAVDLLMGNPKAITYLERSKVDRRLKIVLDLGTTP